MKETVFLFLILSALSSCINNGCGEVEKCVLCRHCINEVFEPELGEIWLDCGGDCPECEDCHNGILDGLEHAVDCGGLCTACTELCNNGLLDGYEDEIDCEYATDVMQGGCAFCPTCTDGIMNGNETGVDCGGSECPDCLAGIECE